MGMLVLAADADPIMCKTIKFILRDQGYDVVTATSGSAAVAIAQERQPEAYILDVGLPDIDCVKLYGHLSRAGIRGSVLFLVPRETLRGTLGESADRLGLFLDKPFDPDALIARVKELEVARRAATIPVDMTRRAFGSLDLWPARGRMVIRDGEVARIVPLTPLEVAASHRLMESGGQMVSRDELFESIPFLPDVDVESTRLDAWMAELQSKIEDGALPPRYMEIADGLGFRFLDDGGSRLN